MNNVKVYSNEKLRLLYRQAIRSISIILHTHSHTHTHVSQIKYLNIILRFISPYVFTSLRKSNTCVCACVRARVCVSVCKHSQIRIHYIYNSEICTLVYKYYSKYVISPRHPSGIVLLNIGRIRSSFRTARPTFRDRSYSKQMQSSRFCMISRSNTGVSVRSKCNFRSAV